MAVPGPEERVDNMSAVELADGEEVEGGNKKADPAGEGHRVQEHQLVGAYFGQD